MTDNKLELMDNGEFHSSRKEEDTDFDQYLEDMSSDDDMKVSIHRKYPSWAEIGWLASIDVSTDNPLTLYDIKRRFGGGTYFFKFRKGRKILKTLSAEIAGDPVNSDGTIAVNPNKNRHLDKITEMMTLMKAMQQPRQDPLEGIAKIIESIRPQTQAPAQSETEKMWKILSTANERHIQLLQNQVNAKSGEKQFDIGEMVKNVKQMKELAGLFGGAPTEEPAGNDTQPLEIVQQLLGFFDNNKKTEKNEEFEEEYEEDTANDTINFDSLLKSFGNMDRDQRIGMLGALIPQDELRDALNIREEDEQEDGEEGEN